MVGKILSDRYELIELISEGGTSEVFLAKDIKSENTVVLKLIKENLLYGDEGDKFKALERLKRELKMSEQLTHENIIIARSMDEYNGRHYIVLDYVPGISLQDIIKEEVLGLGFIIRLTMELCSILDYAHSKGIVHRDLKPSNIMISRDGKIKILDFGLALDIVNSQKLTHAGAILGTPDYISPEQAMNSTVDHRADLYSLGVILYELLTARKPFTGQNKITVIMQHVNDPPKLPTIYNPYIPESIEKIVMKLLEKKPEDRFSSSKDIIEAIQNIIKEGDLPKDLSLRKIHLNKRASLINRDYEFKQLYEEIDRIKNKNKIKIIVLSGNPGNGKTRLIEEIETYTKIRKYLFFKGNCKKEKKLVPYYPLIQALSVLFDKKRSRIWSKLFKEDYNNIQEMADTMYPSFIPLLETSERRSEGEDIPNISEFLLDFLLELSDIKSIIIAIEDLQWCDISTFNLLGRLSKKRKKFNVIVIGSIDEDRLMEEVDSSSKLIQWKSELKAEIINIENLTPEQTAEMINSILMTDCTNEKLCQEIYRASEGNPLFIKESVNYLVEKGVLIWDDKNWSIKEDDINLPPSLRDLLMEKINQLDKHSVELLAKASLIGHNFSQAHLKMYENREEFQSEEVISYLLDQALKKGIIKIEIDDIYSFANQKTYEIFYDNLPEETRRELHLKIAQKLEIKYTAPEIPELLELARHFTLGKEYSMSNLYLMQAASKMKDIGLDDSAGEIYSHALKQCKFYDSKDLEEKLRKKCEELEQ